MLSYCVTDPALENLYAARLNHASDCGFDLYIRSDTDFITVPANARSFKIFTGIKCRPSEKQGYFLFPRSSIIKTTLRLANSVGIIDPEYRGEIIAVVDNLSDEPVTLTSDRSLFQLCMPSLLPFQATRVDSLDETARGSGGFGSTH
jgi:dUTP pyrophosphatase